jgi:hypothetical protein
MVSTSHLLQADIKYNTVRKRLTTGKANLVVKTVIWQEKESGTVKYFQTPLNRGE